MGLKIERGEAGEKNKLRGGGGEREGKVMEEEMQWEMTPLTY